MKGTQAPTRESRKSRRAQRDESARSAQKAFYPFTFPVTSGRARWSRVDADRAHLQPGHSKDVLAHLGYFAIVFSACCLLLLRVRAEDHQGDSALDCSRDTQSRGLYSALHRCPDCVECLSALLIAIIRRSVSLFTGGQSHLKEPARDLKEQLHARYGIGRNEDHGRLEMRQGEARPLFASVLRHD